MFTVVKKVLSEDEMAPDGTVHRKAGSIVLRLVLDQRVPNLYWREPPWVALGGPGALASLDLSAFGEGARLMMATGDVPDYYYRLGLPPPVSEWFCIPDVTLDVLSEELVRQGHGAVAAQLRADNPSAEFVGLVAPAMGWSWAVFLAQSALQDMVSSIPSSVGEPAWMIERALVDGAPPPVLQLGADRAHSEYIDDYFLLLAGRASQVDLLREQMSAYAEQARQHLKSWGFPVHKEEFGEQVSSLGHLVGGAPPQVMAAPAKQWLAIECCWEMAQRGRAHPAQVESVVSLCSWIFMVCRGGLSVFQEVYRWCRLFREHRGSRDLPKEVRRELAAAAVLILLVAQRIDASWFPVATLFDASDLGGGVCQSEATSEELRDEGRWAVRGGWVTAHGDSETLQQLFPTPVIDQDLEVNLKIPPA